MLSFQHWRVLWKWLLRWVSLPRSQICPVCCVANLLKAKRSVFWNVWGFSKKFAQSSCLSITLSFSSVYDFIKQTPLHLCVLSSSHQDQNQGGETGERGPQGDLAEEEEGCETGIPKKERSEDPHVVSEEWRWLSLLAAGQPKQRLSHYGPQDGQAVPHHRHSQVGQIQQGVQKDLEEAAKPQVPYLRKSLQIIQQPKQHFHPTFEWTCTYEQPKKAPFCLYTAYIIYFYVFFRPTLVGLLFVLFKIEEFFFVFRILRMVHYPAKYESLLMYIAISIQNVLENYQNSSRMYHYFLFFALLTSSLLGPPLIFGSFGKVLIS